MVKANQDGVGEQCRRNVSGVLAVCDEDEEVVWMQSSHETLQVRPK